MMSNAYEINQAETIILKESSSNERKVLTLYIGNERSEENKLSIFLVIRINSL
jgi:hypothetical protein